ncbi:dihydrofolate reductase family protein [Nocardia sp. NBC_00511]|uniref:dihydrofolate reductase family protein n=1 Tax=Nocardia sp. NBC_00511 TaxID=2903591 RepID=UPI0030E0AF49
MRKITAGLFISLDGVVAEPQDWHFPYFNDEMGEAVGAQLGEADTLLLGRVTYEGFAGAWPEREAAGGEDAGMAKAFGDARKIVVSQQELSFSWRNSEQLQGDLVAGVAALKAEAGESAIGMSGSPSIVRQLLEAGLIDELHLLVHPIALQSGLKLFAEGQPIPLDLLSAKAFKTGVVHLVYGPAELPAPVDYDEMVNRESGQGA